MYSYMIGAEEIGNYVTAVSYARDKIMSGDPREIAVNADIIFDDTSHSFSFNSLSERLSVTLPECGVVFAETNQLPVFDWRLMALHYIGTADGCKLSGDLAHFRSMPGGNAYESAFKKRSVDILVSQICNKPVSHIEKVCEALGGNIQKGVADVQAESLLFPRFPVTVQIWAEDDEMKGSASILFDSKATHYLPTEDMAVAASVVARFIAKQYRIMFAQ